MSLRVKPAEVTTPHFRYEKADARIMPDGDLVVFDKDGRRELDRLAGPIQQTKIEPSKRGRWAFEMQGADGTTFHVELSRGCGSCGSTIVTRLGGT